MSKRDKDILFLCQYFYPENNSSASLIFDTAKYLVSYGYSVDALVGYPQKYYTNKNLPQTEMIKGIGIRRIRYYQHNQPGTIKRLISFSVFTIKVMMKTSTLKNYKAVIVYSDPPILPIVPIIAKKKYGIKFVFVAYDVYPEIAYSSHVLTPKGIINRVMNQINRQLYCSADCVVALTDEMKDFLLDNRPELDKNRIVTIANWACEEPIKQGRDIVGKTTYQDNQFVVSYFGNLGICQDIDTILQAAELLQEDKRIRFEIAGQGNKKDAVKAKINGKRLKNVQLFDYLVGEKFLEALSAASCCIVSLEKGLLGTCAPSKYYSYLYAGLPVLAVSEKKSYLAKEIEREKIGYSIENGDGEGLKKSIVAMVENPEECTEMGKRAKELYNRQYTYAMAMKKYGSVIVEKCEVEPE